MKLTAKYDSNGNIVLVAMEQLASKVDVLPQRASRAREYSSVWNTARVVEMTRALYPRPRFHITLPKFARRDSRRHAKKLPPHIATTSEVLRFTGTFTGVFIFLFIAFNFSSYFQVIQANLLPASHSEEQKALTAITQPLLREKLGAVPRLPTAGVNLAFAQTAISVLPPDNRLVIPKIGKNIPLVKLSGAAMAREDWKMFENDVQQSLRFGVVHYPGTANPGEVGNVFITGHSSYYPWDGGKYKDVFALLPSLEIGDEYSIYFEGEIHHYRISNKFEVSPKNVTVLDQPTDRYMSTLMTCTPIGTTLRRMIIQADEFDLATGMVMAVGEQADSAQDSLDWHQELPV